MSNENRKAKRCAKLHRAGWSIERIAELIKLDPGMVSARIALGETLLGLEQIK